MQLITNNMAQVIMILGEVSLGNLWDKSFGYAEPGVGWWYTDTCLGILYTNVFLVVEMAGMT